MRIVHLTRHFIPGMGYSENYLPKEEKKLGNDVFVLTSCMILSFSGDEVMRCKTTPPKAASFTDLSYDGILIRRLPHLLELRSISQLVLKGIVQSLREFDPDVVFLPFVDVNSMLVMLLKPLLRYKVVASCGMPVNSLDRSTSKLIAYRTFKSFMAPIFSKFVDAFVEATPENLARDTKEFHISPPKIHFVPLGADINLFKRDEHKRKQTREILSIEEDEILYVYSGKLKKDKGIEILVDAFARLVRSYKKTKLLIMGKGSRDFVNRIQKKAFSYGVDENVIFHDLVPHHKLPDFYNAADVAVWPGSPSISIQEAISSGLPMIVRKSGHTVHLLEYGNGLSFHDSSVKELYICMNKLYKNSELRKQMSIMSRRLAEDKLDWTVIARRIVSIYESLLGSSR